MPSFSVSAELLQEVSKQLRGAPIHAGPDGNLLDPGVMEVLDDHDVARSPWQPGNLATTYLVLAAEACQDLIHVAATFRRGRAERRVLKQMTVPMCSLMDQLQKLFALVNTPEGRAERDAWDPAHQASFTTAARELRKRHLDGPVRTVRNKLGAHLDAEALGSTQAKIRPEELLPALGASIVLLSELLKHRDPYAWIRPVADPRGRAVETFYTYPLCARWLTDEDGHATALAGLFVATDPRDHIRGTAAEAAASYNQLVERTGARHLELLELYTHDEAIVTTPIVAKLDPDRKTD